jgi:hypothetical protein
LDAVAGPPTNDRGIMALAQYDVVRLRRDMVEPPLATGVIGAIVLVHEGGTAYEVEFCDSEGVTLALMTLTEDDLEKVH